MNGDLDRTPGTRPGDVLADRYVVERVLGVGGMGVVVAARDLPSSERIALKFLRPKALRSVQSVARFLQEARAAVQIKSDHVTRVTDVGRLASGSPYMVMEYLDGIDLSVWLRERGRMPASQAVELVLQACEAIGEAHARGIVHRDLKPANLFCVRRPDGRPSIKVLDFGISKITAPSAPTLDLTRTTSLIGSPLYMSPEQMRHSRSIDSRADIWSLGVTLFELVSGKPPFRAEAVTELAIKVANDPTPSLASLCDDAPPGLDAVIARCLEKDPASRFQTVADLALELREFAPRRAQESVDRVLATLPPAHLTPLPIPAAPEQPIELEPSKSWEHTIVEQRKRGPRAILGIAGAIAMCLLAASAASVLALRRPPASVRLSRQLAPTQRVDDSPADKSFSVDIHRTRAP